MIGAAWIRAPLNVRKVVAYLRAIGIELLPTEVRGWYEQEAQSRHDRRRVRICEGFYCKHCGHQWTREGKRRVRRVPPCPLCGRPNLAVIGSYWLEWYERADGTRVTVRD